MIMYALVIDNVVQSVGRLPNSARRLDTGDWVMGLDSAPVALVEACGWFPVADTPPVFDPALEVLVRGDVIVVEGAVVRDYTVRDKTPEELAADAFSAAVSTNTQTLTDPTEVEEQLTALKLFLVDPDVQRVLDQPNNTALATSDLNRALKSVVRQLRRQANMTIRLSRVSCGQINPELLVDVSDVGEA